MRLTVTLFTVLLALPRLASACGGFFCDSVPVLQAAERILFSVDEAANTTTVHVQITYSGAAESFAWVVPVPSVPQIEVGIDDVFTALATDTAPSYQVNTTLLGDCEDEDWFGGGGGAGGTGGAGGSGGRGGAGGGVSVLSQEPVGPYEQATLAATDSGELFDWLVENGYDVPPAYETLLAPYVAGGSYFVALRLQQNRDAGDIAPLVMTYEGTTPSIPIQLTAIAATDDMRLEVYLAGDARSVPLNYLHVELNDAAMDWRTNGSNRSTVITEAANEAGGLAFATDYAGSPDLVRTLWTDDLYDVADIADSADGMDLVDALSLQNIFARRETRAMVERYIPYPSAAARAEIPEQDFYGSLPFYRLMLFGVQADAAGFAAEFDERVVQPLKDGEALIHSSTKLSRLTSSISPAEMTMDPIFGSNPTMADVSNVHTAERFIMCEAGEYSWNSPAVYRFADGSLLYDELDSGAWHPGAFDGLNAAVIEVTAATGSPGVFVDNRPEIQSVQNNLNSGMTFAVPAADPTPETSNPPPGPASCNATGSTIVGVFAALLFMRRSRHRASAKSPTQA